MHCADCVSDLRARVIAAAHELLQLVFVVVLVDMRVFAGTDIVSAEKSGGDVYS